MGALDVARPDGGHQPVDRPVRDRDGFFFVREFHGRQHRPENLFLGDLHVGFHVAEHGGLHKEPLGFFAFRIALAAAEQLGSFLDARFDITEDAVELGLGNL